MNGEKILVPIASVAREILTTPLAPINFIRNSADYLERCGFTGSEWRNFHFTVDAIVLIGPFLEGLTGFVRSGDIGISAMSFTSIWMVESLYLKILRLDRPLKPRHNLQT